MSWVAPRTYVTGEVITASILNQHLRDNTRYLKGLDGAVTVEAALTVDSLVTSGNVDGVDVSTHAGGDAYAQHANNVGNHTHQSSGAQGNTLDHGLALTGLTDDDHTQYQKESLLTTRGDIAYRGAAEWARLAKGTEGTVLRMGADDPAWASAVATQEFMVLPTRGPTLANMGDFYSLWKIDSNGESVSFAFNIPSDFSSLTSAKVVGIKDTSGNIDWTTTTDFGAIGEVYTTNSDSATADGVAMTDNEIEAIDVSAALTGLAADDYVGLHFVVDVISAGDWDIIGLTIKYT